MAQPADVYLQDTFNHGASTSLIIGKTAGVSKKRTLLQFNLATVPTNATVLNARLQMNAYAGNGSTWVDRWVQVHQMLVEWDEGIATKDLRLFEEIGIPWSTPYAGINGTDANAQYESTLLFQETTATGGKIWDLSALTQKWVTGSATNYGVILWTTSEGTDGKDLRFRSSEYTVFQNLWPKLEITYSTETKTVYFLKDHLGSIRATVLDSIGAPVIGYDDYDPWGYPLALRTKPIPTPYLQGASKNKFTEKEWDDEYGLNWYHIGVRYYDPQIGRWLVRDLAAEKYLSWSPYVYSLNNPILFFDPNGKYPFTIHVRTFAPFNWFGGGFRGEGENRRFSTAGNAKSKIRQEVAIESTTGKVTNAFARGSTSQGGYGLWSAGSEAYLINSDRMNSLVTHLYGNNDAASELSADIDVHSLLYIKTTKGDNGNEILTLQGGLLGDLFPAAEAFVKDAFGNAIFLGVSSAGGSAASGPYKMLPGDMKRGMTFVNLSIVVGSGGKFIGVLVNGRFMSIAEWNSEFEKQDPKRYERRKRR